MPKPLIKKRNSIIYENEDLNSQIVPSFIQKTYDILNNSENETLIHWSNDGTTFIIEDIVGFTSKIVPNVFKHENYASFIRQLNMYDFHKMKTSKHKHAFKHTYFQRDSPELLINIKRKGAVEVIANYSKLPNSYNPSAITNVQENSYKIDQLIQNNKEIEKKIENIIEVQEEFRNNQTKLIIDLTKMNEKIANLEKISFCITSFLTSRGMLQDAIKDYSFEFPNSNLYQYLNMGEMFKTLMGGLPMDFPLYKPLNLSLQKKINLNQPIPMIENRPMTSPVNQANPIISTPIMINIDSNANSMKEMPKTNMQRENFVNELGFNPFGVSPASMSYKISPNLNYSQFFPSPCANFQCMGGDSPNPHYFSQLNDYGKSDNQSLTPKN